MVQVDLAGIGLCQRGLVNKSALGLRCTSAELADAARAGLLRKLAWIREANEEFIARAIKTANKIAQRLERAV